MTHRLRAGLVLLALLGTLAPLPVDAQVRRGRASQEAAPPWTPISVGVVGGYDQSTARAGGAVLGASVRLPLMRSGHVRLLPNAHMTFVRDGKEYQYSLEAVYVTGGRQGGLYAGAGLGQRTSTLGFSATDDSARTYSLLAGVTGRLGGTLETIVEFRYIYMDGFRARPSPITIGLNLPLWTNPPPGS